MLRRNFICLDYCVEWVWHEYGYFMQISHNILRIDRRCTLEGTDTLRIDRRCMLEGNNTHLILDVYMQTSPCKIAYKWNPYNRNKKNENMNVPAPKCRRRGQYWSNKGHQHLRGSLLHSWERKILSKHSPKNFWNETNHLTHLIYTADFWSTPTWQSSVLTLSIPIYAMHFSFSPFQKEYTFLHIETI